MNRWRVDNIQSYCKSITQEPLSFLRQKGFWVEDEEYRSSHLFGIRILGKDAQQIKEALGRNKIYVSFRGDAIRVSPNVYNDERDMNKLARVLSKGEYLL